ncbi:creatininase family protein [bacterium]|nr:creatininase family protein [bacterium]
MGAFSDNLKKEVRLEFMRPEQVEEAKRTCPNIYVPFGSIEWHGYQNVVGLDALKAHEQLVGLAVKAGGVVYPPVYFGAGGGHGDWPSSFMVSAAPMVTIVTDLLKRFEADGYKKAILLSGHYPNRSQYLDTAIDAYAKGGGTMRVLAIVENQAPGVGGDHAAKFETSFMLHLHPESVDMARLDESCREDVSGPDEKKNWMGSEWKGHPCYGLVGADPRGNASAALGRENTERLIAHLEQWLRQEPA